MASISKLFFWPAVGCEVSCESGNKNCGYMVIHKICSVDNAGFCFNSREPNIALPFKFGRLSSLLGILVIVLCKKLKKIQSTETIWMYVATKL